LHVRLIYALNYYLLTYLVCLPQTASRPVQPYLHILTAAVLRPRCSVRHLWQ